MVKVNSFLEITTGCIRLGPSASAYGDPYDHFVSFVVTDNRTAVLKGWIGTPTHEHRRAIQRVLAPLGLRPDWTRAHRLTTPRKRAKTRATTKRRRST
jgi:hypothetical protein